MKARMEVTLDTIWTNQVSLSVECELDNPHVLTSSMLAEMMVHRLKTMVEEVRGANERAALELGHPAGEQPTAAEEPQPTHREGEPERERRSYEDMHRERESQQILREPETGS